MPGTSTVTVMEVLSCCLLCFVCFFCLCFSSARRYLLLNTSPNEGGCVVYQGPNQTNQDPIQAWLKHEEPNSTRQQQEVINQTLAPARLNTACNSKTKGTLNDNSNAGIW